MKHAEIAKALTKAVEPFVRGMTEDLVAIAAKSVTEQLGVAREHAIAKLREQLTNNVTGRDPTGCGHRSGVQLPHGPQEGTPDVEKLDERLGDGESDRSGPCEPERVDDARARRSTGRDRARVEVSEATGATAGAPASDPAPAAPRVKKTRAKMACGKCGAIGYRADGCGRTHNVDASSTPSPPPHHCRRVGSVLANRSRRARETRRPLMPTRSLQLWV